MKNLSYLLVLVVILSACSEKTGELFEHSGGSIRMSLDNGPSTYNPYDVKDYYSATIMSQVMEGLVGLDPKSTKIIPQIASEWMQSEDGKSFTFNIRNDIFFHPHAVFKNKKQRKLSVQDIVHTIEKACRPDETGSPTATYSFIYKSLLKGADEYYSGKASNIKGLVVNGNKITFNLLKEDQNFLYRIANVQASIMSSKILKSGNESAMIGTGPFMLSDSKSDKKILLVRNPDYYERDDNGFVLPYLESITFNIENRKLEQLSLFESGETDLIIGLPTNRITKMLEGRIEDFNSKPPKLVLSNNPLLETNYYFFNMKDERFKDPKVRMAFNYALDKKALDLKILRNQHNDLGSFGITPPIPSALRGYDFQSLKQHGYEYNPDKARKLLAEAGYPDGKGFGTVLLRYNIDEVHSAIADEFANQIFAVLGVNVNIDGSTFEQLNKDYINGNGDIFRTGWTADYPSPESFLLNFYGKYVPENDSLPSPINHARYKNPIFDTYFDQARNAIKMSDQMRYFALAEISLMNDPPIIPLWYTGDIQISYAYIRNFHFNSLNYLNFKKVYIKEWTPEEYQMKHSENK